MLPIHAVLEPLKAALGATRAVVLAAPPGAGKTTVVPLALLDQPWLGGGKLLVLEPRRLAARAAAERMAATLGEQIGETVGYRTRLQSRIGPATRIEVITEGVFTRMILDDPGLEGVGAAASIFFAYVGFDAVSTAAEETKNPQRNVPIGLIGSLAICTVFYLLVAAGAIGAIGAQPVIGADGSAVQPGSPAFIAACQLAENANQLVCSNEALAHVLRVIDHEWVGNMVGTAAVLALPSVILMMIFGQTRIFFVMARDGLLPEGLAKVHPKWKTPYIVTLFTGIAVAIAGALFPVGQLADISNSGTLFAFFMVAIAVMILRVKEPGRHRPFRTPLVWIIAPLSAAGCAFLFWNLPHDAKMVLPIWGGIGLVIYLLYGIRKSHVARGLVDVPELDSDAPPGPVPPMPGAPSPTDDHRN